VPIDYPVIASEAWQSSLINIATGLLRPAALRSRLKAKPLPNERHYRCANSTSSITRMNI
jgi:hypothetical protein